MGSKAFFLLVACLSLTATAAAQDRQYRALVIGNGQYARPLNWPVTNERAIAGRLKELQFDVASCENANNKRLVSALAAFRQKIAPGDIVVLYYAGRVSRSHGTPVIVPLDDTDPDIDLGIPLQNVFDILERSRAALSLVVLDVLAEWPVFGLDIGKEWMGAIPQPPAHTVILSASAAAGRGSLTSELLHALDKPARSIAELVEEIKAATARRDLFRIEGDAPANIPVAPAGDAR
jgi:uncharacterized caspase-like protein